MKVKTEGHTYELSNFENKETSQALQFIHKEPSLNPIVDGVLKTISDGTTNEEVLEVLIDRMVFYNLNSRAEKNAIVITKLEESLMWLNKRTADRMKRDVEGKHLK